MKNRFIFPSVAKLASSKAVKIDGTLMALSEINPAVHLFTIMLSSKELNQAGC